jgi:hypothetical protein
MKTSRKHEELLMSAGFHGNNELDPGTFIFFTYMNQLLLCPDFTDSCFLAIWFSVEVLGNRQILYKNVSTFIWICLSIGIRPEMMHGTISGAFCGSSQKKRKKYTN